MKHDGVSIKELFNRDFIRFNFIFMQYELLQYLERSANVNLQGS